MLKPLLRRWIDAALAAFNRLRLPSASLLPVAGAVVGLYSGLAAGIFSNLIGVIRGLVFGGPRLLTLLHPGSTLPGELARALREAPWHFELIIVILPLALSALLVSRLIEAGGVRDVVKERLRILALLTLGALALYYPLAALSALSSVIGSPPDFIAAVRALPFWAKVLVPALGGAIVGHLLRNRPETHGHGVPEVVIAVENERGELSSRGGILKLVASAVTIGAGGSGGREGPIVYGGAAFAAAVGRTLGFRRKDLSVLLAAGAGGGIAASFNAPIAGAVFALEIILRQFELRVFSPIILASVTATLVARGTVGGDVGLAHLPYEMKSGWEIIGYGALGLICGALAFAFIQLLHQIHELFLHQGDSRLARWLHHQPLWARASIGGALNGCLLFATPVVWGSGREFASMAAGQQLTLAMLLIGCVGKLVGTSITLGSGGSGGTFFPATVIGAMAGGALGVAMHHLLPGAGVSSGAYAVVGMGGCVAALTRGPLTGMMMIYELSGTDAVILPLMVTCSIASAFCHSLVERRDRGKNAEVAARMAMMPVTDALVPCRAVLLDQTVAQVLPALLSAGGALPVVGKSGILEGVLQQDDLADLWSEENLFRTLLVADVVRPVKGVSPEATFGQALERMTSGDVGALPVLGTEDTRSGLAGIVTRAAIQRVQEAVRTGKGLRITAPMAPTELAGVRAAR